MGRASRVELMQAPMSQSTAFGGALRARRGTAFRSVLLCGIVLSGCGDPEPKEPGSGEAPVVRGGERLAFDQSASSSSELSRYQLVLYVDGSRATFANTRCDSQPVAGRFLCSGVLPALSRGTHSLQVATTLDGQEDSSRSGPLVVTSVSQEAGLALQTAPADTVPTASSDIPLCWTIPEASCFQVSELFSTNEQIASLAITHDGRVMLIENGRRIRVLANNAIRSEPAFQGERATDRIVDIAIDGISVTQAPFTWLGSKRSFQLAARSPFRDSGKSRTSWAKALQSCQVCRCRTKATPTSPLMTNGESTWLCHRIAKRGRTGTSFV